MHVYLIAPDCLKRPDVWTAAIYFVAMAGGLLKAVEVFRKL